MHDLFMILTKIKEPLIYFQIIYIFIKIMSNIQQVIVYDKGDDKYYNQVYEYVTRNNIKIIPNSYFINKIGAHFYRANVYDKVIKIYELAENDYVLYDNYLCFEVAYSYYEINNNVNQQLNIINYMKSTN